MLANAIYILCTLTSLLCAILLLSRYRQTGVRILLWSGLCFVGLMVNNILLFVDKVIYADTEIAWMVTARSLAAVVGLSLLLFGLVWDSE
jgi:hypothetical protein